MVNNVTKIGAVAILLGLFFTIGSGIYYTVISNFNFPNIIEDITYTVNYVFDLLFGSLRLLSFFIRPSTLSYVSRAFCFIWLLHFEFKFMRTCIKLTLRLYEACKDLLAGGTGALLKLFGM